MLFDTVLIQPPGLGINFPAPIPTKIRGSPIPILIANRAEPPRKASPVLDINRTAPASEGATHGPIHKCR